MPPNLARLLYVVVTLLEYGRHLAATVERRSTMPGFAAIVWLLGTANLRIILAQLQRGILRAAALETLLRSRAATGRDVTMAPIRTAAAPGADRDSAAAIDAMLHEPLAAQVEHLAAQRARYDAPVDPDNLPTPEQIEAEIRRQPIGRTIEAICRDFGVVPGACTHGFWDAITLAVACYGGNSMAWMQDRWGKSDRFLREQEEDPAVAELARHGPLDVREALGFGVGEPPVDPCDIPVLVAASRRTAPPPEECAAAAAEPTGPPLRRAALPLAA